MATEKQPMIYAKMADILQEVAAIGKGHRNTTQNFDYRGIDDVYNVMNPLLVKHRVFMSSEILGKTREERTNKNGTVLAFTCLRMRYRFHAEDGSHVETDAEGEGMDSGDKSSNKAMAVAHKYALLQAFCIPTKDLDDPDADSHEVGSKAPAQQQRPPLPKADQEPSTERRQAAANWCYEAKAHVLSLETRHGLDTWATKNAKALDSAKPLAPNAHKALWDAIEQRRNTLQPMAAE